MPIEKLLVANRGEIARRIFRTCRSMGIETVAVHSDADAGAPFVREAGEAVSLGGRRSADSYLRGDRIVDAARRTGADAIHPGYGFLSESAAFSRLCRDAGITFVGPSPDVIDLMASKPRARSFMEEAGVPVVPGWHPAADEVAPPADVLERLGFPLLVKASFGGGGRGMRIVAQRDQLQEAVEAAQREAASAFGDGAVFVERYISAGRHIEVQILGDNDGDVVHLSERECSIQRRHQKIIEEAPAPNLPTATRDRMHAAAVAAGTALGYRGAGTVEFILAPDGEFYFLEVNTRLQVEHPITEMVLGLDLVRLQLLVAEGEPLPEEARSPIASGHAIEARLYAEDPSNNYAPAPGIVHRFDISAAAGVRVDSGVESSSEVTADYDPMLAKVIAHGATRSEAIRRLRAALRSARLHGVTTNRELLSAILAHPTFASGTADTTFLDEVGAAALVATASLADDDVRLSLLAASLAGQVARRDAAAVLRDVPSGWRNNPGALQHETFVVGGVSHLVQYRLGRSPLFRIDEMSTQASVSAASSTSVTLVYDGVAQTFAVARIDDTVYVDGPAGSLSAMVVPRFPDARPDVSAGSLTAPMPGTIVKVAVTPGELVEPGDLIVVMEAMKTEHAVCAPASGLVREVTVAVGENVDVGALLAVVEVGESSVPSPP